GGGPGDGLQAEVGPCCEVRLYRFRGGRAGHEAAVVDLLAVAPYLENGAAGAADVVVDSDVRGQAGAGAVRSEVDGRWRGDAESIVVCIALEREGLTAGALGFEDRSGGVGPGSIAQRPGRKE